MEEGPLAGAGVSAGAGGPAGAMDGGGLRLRRGVYPNGFRNGRCTFDDDGINNCYDHM